MKPTMLAVLAALYLAAWTAWAAWTPQALAHGTAPHPKCKKGYALDGRAQVCEGAQVLMSPARQHFEQRRGQAAVTAQMLAPTLTRTP
jgi:hypothetical protein